VISSIIVAVIIVAALAGAYALGWSDHKFEVEFDRKLNRLVEVAIQAGKESGDGR
jgi:hypothetical protein